MRIVSFLLLVTVLQVSASTSAQTINLDLNNASLKKVFKEIRMQSGYNFIYTEQMVANAKPVSIHVHGFALTDVLNQIFSGQPLNYTISKNTIVVNDAGNGESNPYQSISPVLIKGTVTDENGLALPGTVVTVLETGKSVSTDQHGNYAINAELKQTLVFSFIGYKKIQVTVPEGRSINIKMEPLLGSINEVVVVGYGVQKKQNLTGAVSTVDSKILEDRPINRLSEGLQGAIGNLNITQNSGNNGGGAPNSTQSINIRGFTGLGQTAGPLIVIDGVQANNSTGINDLNPNDIESISLIKDAAAAAVYGSSAPYGVLIVNTKKGRKNGKPSISYNNNFNLSHPIGLPKMLNSVTFAELYNEADDNAGVSHFFGDDAITRMKDFQAGKIKTQTIADTSGSNDYYLSWGGANANNDWFKVYLKNLSFSQQHNISVSGGTENTNYFVGLGYNEKNGLYTYGFDKYRRFNFRANMGTKINSWLSFNLRSSFSRELFNTPNYGGNETGDNWMHQIARKHPNIPTVNPDGNYNAASDIQFQLDAGRHTTSNDHPVLTGEFVASLAKGWSATVNYTFDNSYYNQQDVTKTLYGQTPKGKIYPLTWSYPNDITIRNTSNLHQVTNAFTTYNYKLAKHNFTLLGGFVAESYNYKALYSYNSNLYSNDIPSLTLTYNSTPATNDNGSYSLASEGFFGRFNYDYDGKYLLELDGRYDASSRFLANNRWKVYPGVSGGWNIHKEKFWKSLSFGDKISTFKIRGSYGKLGDQNITDAYGNQLYYPFYPAMGTTTPTSTNWLFSNGRQAAVSLPGLVDPNLTWMTVSTLDFGADATFFNNRLSVTYDWYKRSVNDEIGPAQALPAILGTSAPQTNSAAMQTKGFELSVAWKDAIGKVNYSLRATLSDYTGMVTKYPNPSGILSVSGADQWYKGKTMGEIWGYQTAGYFQSQADPASYPDQSYIYSKWGAGDIRYADLNGDGKINKGDNTLANHGDLKVIGNSTPRYSYSLYTNVSWKNFDLSTFLQGVAKRQSWLASNYFIGITGSEWQSSPFTTNLDRWTPTTPSGFFPKYYMDGSMNGKNFQPQTKYLLNTAYMRIKNVQLGYTLPAELLRKTTLSRLRFYISVDNLATFSPMKAHSNLDPELSVSDAKIYPLQRNYSMGINASF